MARKPRTKQPQGDEESLAADVTATPAPEETRPRSAPKRTEHEGGIVSLDY
jgi:hypothetical protein